MRAMDIEMHEAWFDAFARDKIAQAGSDAEPLILKLRHTKNVLQNAIYIAENEHFSEELKRASILAALYHDIARFDQYLDYRTFKDAQSRNHGLWAVQILKNERRFNEEPPKIAALALAAIGMHNRRGIPAHLPPDVRLAACTVRDADKLDILRVMDEHLSGPRPYNPTVILSLPDDPGLYSVRVIANALAEKAASYNDLRSVNDFRLLLGSWFYELSFASSRKRLIDKGHAANLVKQLPDDEIYGAARKAILKRFANIMD